MMPSSIAVKIFSSFFSALALSSRTKCQPHDNLAQAKQHPQKIFACHFLLNESKIIKGLSYPEIGRVISRTQSTMFEYFIKMRQSYTAIYS